MEKDATPSRKGKGVVGELAYELPPNFELITSHTTPCFMKPGSYCHAHSLDLHEPTLERGLEREIRT